MVGEMSGPRRTVTISGYRLVRTPRRTHLHVQRWGDWSWLGCCEQPTARASWQYRGVARATRYECECDLVRAYSAPDDLLTAPDVAPRETTTEPDRQGVLPMGGRDG
jgi:hypothetical protein